ncbi:beta-galactosidase [Cryobacterium lactosi]|uniref:Beta-galactosidase n=1 Tax=Cryobacterium lactosi TaxID=1259202 RepID=A0A4R9BTF0_9MICO|nr:beta-galactosidase [Cryobacterium lactosi]TFD90642.1 beta-galactosidase [Cryobacterium lactosi]
MIHFGGDYNPEQWPEETWPDDIARMREAGVTMVSLGVFAWARIQPAEDVFDFDWLDRVIDLLHAGGIAVDLATATASPPPWASLAYPELLAQDETGAVYWPGSRQHYAPSSPQYRRLAAALVTRLAARYAAHPAVVLWHVNNEYGCHLHQDYSDAARDAFRRWLADRYGTIGALNDAWGTMFWAQAYGTFAEVFPPRKAPYSHNPAQLLDFRRFSSDMLLECYRAEKAIIRAAGATQPVTTNFMGAFKPADYWAWAAEVDVISDDCYPDPNDPESFRAAAFQRDLMRSLKPDVPWLLMEQSSNALNWRRSNAPKAPGQMAALSMQAVARGADAVLFFQWRQSRAGAEKFHSAMLPHAGTGTRTWREIVGLGAELAALPALPAGARDARVAIVFDWENWWALENPDHPVVLDYLELVQRWYAALHRQHVQVDLVPASGDLAGYALVIAPQLYLLRADAAANLTAFVRAGGHLLVTAFSDVVDECDRFRDGGFLTQLSALLGVRVEEFGALMPPGSAEPGQQQAPFEAPGGGGPLTGTLLAEELWVGGNSLGGAPGGRGSESDTASDVGSSTASDTSGHGVTGGAATVLSSYTAGRTLGLPAFTVNAVEAGLAYYLATIPDAAGTAAIVRYLLAGAGVDPVLAGLPDTVEAIRRGDVLTVINHGPDAVEVALPGTAVADGHPVGTVSLAPFAYSLVRTA